MRSCECTLNLTEPRKAVLKTIEKHLHDDDIQGARQAGARILRRGFTHTSPDVFVNAFDTALELILNDSISLGPLDPLRYGNDAAVCPARIDGRVVNAMRVTHEESDRTYPIVQHDEGWRFCTCFAQSHYAVCPHTIARMLLAHDITPVDNDDAEDEDDESTSNESSNDTPEPAPDEEDVAEVVT